MLNMNYKKSCSGNRVMKYNEAYIGNLVSDFKRGKRRSFSEIWSGVSPFINRLMRRGLDKDDAYDLTGEVCINLYEKGIFDYEPAKSSFIAWVYKIALNLKLNFLKKEKPELFSRIEPELKSEGADDITIRADRENPNSKTPLDILIEREENSLKQRALNLVPKLMEQLTPEEQFIIQASIYDDKTDKEIAVMLSADASLADNYKKTRQRALKKIGRRLVLLLKNEPASGEDGGNR